MPDFLKTDLLFHPVGHDRFGGSRPFPEPFKTKPIVLRETFAYPFSTEHEKVTGV